MMSQEEKIWSGTPSQYENLGIFFFCGITFMFVFPIFIALWYWLVVKTTKYELTNHRLKVTTGVLNKKINELELYRVKDYKLDQPLVLRIFSLGNVILKTSDSSHPTVVIRAIKNSNELREKIRLHVEDLRESKGIREIDYA